MVLVISLAFILACSGASQEIPIQKTESNSSFTTIKSVLLDFGGVLVEPDRDTLLYDLGLQEKEIIFIDNQIKNVHAAQDLGIDAIHFISAKELREELIKRKILKN